jgi:hypothetical protein
MLRAAPLLSFLRRILRFSTSGHPEALGACYVDSWQLPRLDLVMVGRGLPTPAPTTKPCVPVSRHTAPE